MQELGNILEVTLSFFVTCELHIMMLNFAERLIVSEFCEIEDSIKVININ